MLENSKKIDLFDTIHSLYIELAKLGYHLDELYDMSMKELLFSLKYRREGDAYFYWKVGVMTRAGVNAKTFPKIQKQHRLNCLKRKIGEMPDWLVDDYQKKLNENSKERRNNLWTMK